MLTASQPFTTALIASNMGMFKHEWIWEKNNSADYANANCRPMKIHEDILVFSLASDVAPGKIKMRYNPQGILISNKINKRGRNSETTGCFNKNQYISKYTNYPKTILKFNSERTKLHPTQKPVALFEYLIKTYTNEGDTVLDNCAGSGTTGVACENTGRNSILIEREPKYCNIIRERMNALQGRLIM